MYLVLSAFTSIPISLVATTVLSAFTSIPISLVAITKASAFFFAVCTLPPSMLKSSA
jgi:hypothetical protein